ncbi:hypothetical protein GFPCMMHI_06388 [Ensifer adhaerens]|nr:hypothetical protein [Ensifer adhaerens]
MAALEMPPFLLEVHASLVIDGAGDWIGEVRFSLIRVITGRHAHGLDLDHPAGTKPRQDGIDLPRHLVTLGVGRTFAVGAGKIPAGHERAVLQENDAVVDQPGIGNEISKGRSGMAERFEGNHAVPPQYLRHGDDVAR